MQHGQYENQHATRSGRQRMENHRHVVDAVVAKHAQDHKQPFYHLQLDNLNSEEALEYCRACFADDKTHSVFFVNAHCFNMSKSDHEYLRALNDCDLLLNDGVGIKIAARMVDLDLKENMNGTDFIPKILQLAADEGKPVFLLGAKPGVADEAKQRLEENFSNLIISGTRSGYFTQEEEADVIAEINASGAEVVVVGMGVPFQEKWIARNQHRFDHAKLLVAGGAIIDFSAGRVRRAPTWIQQAGLEWLYRFSQEPRRLFRRYFIGNWTFLHHVVRERAGVGRHRSSEAR